MSWTATCPACWARSSTSGPSRRALAALGGPPSRLEVSERIFRLIDRPSPVRDPRAFEGGGGLRSRSRRRLERGVHASRRSARTMPTEAEAMADRWLARRERTLYLWEDGEVVSLAGVGGPTPNGIRIGPVYTPPESRRRGYASALVADVSQAELDAGRRFCFLFTDLANKTSNHIYEVDRLRAGPGRRRLPVRDVLTARGPRAITRSPTPTCNLPARRRAARHRTGTLSVLRRGRADQRRFVAFRTSPGVPPDV